MEPSRDHSAIQAEFEQGFLARPLADQIAEVPRYYLYERICRMAREHQPMLEAGCGSGQWVAWAAHCGWEAIGLDWSAELMARAAAEVPDATFLVGDMRKIPLGDASVGSIMSLGAIEHAVEGPEIALTEFVRVLRPGGRAIITVPYLGWVRRAARALGEPLRYSPTLRRLLRKEGGRRPLVRDAAERKGWTADYMATDTGWSFFQYQFDRSTMRRLLTSAGFAIEDEFVFAAEEGLIQTFRGLAGRYTPAGPRLTPIGKALACLLPATTYGHMVGYSVKKP
jgi:SAM-dependent methyltransferase